MMEDNHIADRIGIALVLSSLVLASVAVGAVALGGGAPQATPSPNGFASDRTAAHAFPIENFSATPGQSVGASTQCHGRTTEFAFPIENFSTTPGQSVDASTLSLDQDMEPYALGQDMDPYAFGYTETDQKGKAKGSWT